MPSSAPPSVNAKIAIPMPVGFMKSPRRSPQLKKKKQALITRVGTAAPARSPSGAMPPVK